MKGINPIMDSFMPKERKEPLWPLNGSSSGGGYIGLVFMVLLCLFVVQMIGASPCLSRTTDKQTDKGGLYLGFSSYHNLGMALSEVARLKEQGYRAFYKETGQGKEKKFRVLAGPYLTRTKAAAAGERLKQRGVIDHIQVISVAASNPAKNRVEGKADSPGADRQKGQASTKNQGEKIRKGKAAVLKKSPAAAGEKFLPGRITSKVRQKGKEPVPSSAKPITALPAGKKVENGQTTTKTTLNPSVTPGPLPDVKPLPSLPVTLPTAVPTMPATPAMPSWPYFDNAMKDFQRGQYMKARPVFQSILARSDIGASWREMAERRLVDCMYFLKESNSKAALSELVYQYKNILLKYPDIRHGNDLAYWRLGHLYKDMAFYRDAIDAYKSLMETYPTSPLTEEGLYQIGDLLRLDRKYPEAVEVLRTFYAKYPGSALSREAIFSLADTYYRMGLPQEADVWYNSALQRWPDLYGLPEDIFLNTGYHFYSMGNYRRAFQVFSYFRGLYPGSRYASSATRAMARSLVGMGQTSSAVRLLNAVLARERDKKEAIRLRLLLAELGVQRPGARTSVCFPGVENYREPLLSCDQMLMELNGDALTEEVLYLKANVLTTMNHPREAFDTYATLLRLYPKSRRQVSCRKSLEETRNALINDYYGKGDYLAVADLYFTESGFQYHPDMDVLFKIADSFKHLGLYEQAAKTFQDLKNTQTFADPGILDLAIAEAEIKIGKAREGQARLVMLLAQKGVGGAVVKKARRILADSYYAERNYDWAIESYTAAMPIDRGEKGVALSLYRYADALKRRGRGAQALQYYQEALNSASATPGALSESLKGEIYLSLGECYFAAEQYEQGIPLLTQSLSALPKGSSQRWALFRLTGGYIKTNNPALAEKSSGQVRENTEDPFWATMADYGLNDGIWFATYEDYLK